MGENIWGRPKTPINGAPTVPASTASAASPRSPTSACSCGQAEAEGLLRQPDREAVQRHLQRGAPQGQHSENLIALLESRLDAIVYRAKFVPTPFAARQFVNHGHILVNGKRVNIPSYRVKVGDVVQVRERSRNMALVLEALQLAERDTPDYIEVDAKAMTAKFTAHAGARRGALSGEDGAEPGGRILFALSAAGARPDADRMRPLAGNFCIWRRSASPSVRRRFAESALHIIWSVPLPLFSTSGV